ncbi:MAG: hypothetical protein ACI4VO_02080 [Clostridia bacterium]
MDKDEEVREVLKQVVKEGNKKEEKKEKEAFYKKWWFWLIVVIISIIIVTSDSGENKNLTQTFSNIQKNNIVENRIQETEEEKQARLEKERIEKEQKEAEEKAKKEQEEREFKASCQAYTFEQMARNPDNFKGTNVKVTGEVVQVMSDSYSTNLRVNITKNGTYSTYYTDTIYVVYYPESGEDKILENDIITIYGTSQGDCSYTTVLGSTVTLPNIKAKYITIEK